MIYIISNRSNRCYRFRNIRSSKDHIMHLIIKTYLDFNHLNKDYKVKRLKQIPPNRELNFLENCSLQSYIKDILKKLNKDTKERF